MTEQELAQQNKILEINTGSTLYGTRTPKSDNDRVGVFIANWDYYVGLKEVRIVDSSKQVKDKGGRNTKDSEDCSYYELREYIKLARQGNPNILETLFVDTGNIIHISPIGRKLLRDKHLFVSQSIKQRYLGYAYSQRHKMVMRSDKVNELNAAYEYLEDIRDTTKFMSQLESKIENRSLSFIRWKEGMFHIGDVQVQHGVTVNRAIQLIKGRLDKVGNRKDLILKHGWDLKFGSHLIRLLKECYEILITGKIRFPLQYADEILEIKNGEWTIKQVLDYAEHLEQQIEALDLSHLPKTANYDLINELCKECVLTFLQMEGPHDKMV
tara:strand:+ start:721 stop:1698 length:978 start_codon:yes stop_codon:yes gene_type:complete